MLIPYRTTTPLYYFPWCTLGLIAINVICFYAASYLVTEGQVDALILWHGEGLHPLQWITSNFLHEDLGHLLGNMIFLWVFGQITEGRLGWIRFFLVYVGIGIVQNCGEQILLLGAIEGASYGASSIIYGLIAMSLLWAPRDKIHVWYWLFFRIGTFAVKTVTLAFFYIALDLLGAVLAIQLGQTVSTALLHLSGAFVGFVVGWVLLKKGAIELDGRDILSLWGKPKRPSMRTDASQDGPQEREPSPALLRTERCETALQLMRQYLSEGDAELAIAVYDETVKELGRWRLEEPDLRSLIIGLHKLRAWPRLRPLLVDYIRRFPATSLGMRLILAKICVDVDNSPQRALGVLKSIPPGALPAEQETARRQLLERVKEMRRQSRGD